MTARDDTGLSANQTQYFDTGCRLLGLSCLRAASVSAFSGFVEACTSQWNEEQAMAATLDKVLAMDVPQPANTSLCISDDMLGRMVVAYPGLRPEHLKLIPSSAFCAFYFFVFLTDDAGTLNVLQVSEFNTEMERLQVQVTSRWSCSQQMAVCKQPEMSYDTNCKVSKGTLCDG
eukprot:m51a1_g12683 hypothetical protein (174) ;mRNA; f:1408-2431